MTPQTPHDHHDSTGRALPTLELPPVPFMRAPRAAGAETVASDPMPVIDTRPSGTSIDELMDALRSEPADSGLRIDMGPIMDATAPIEHVTPVEAAPAPATEHDPAFGLQPARPYELPHRSIAPETLRSPRAGIATMLGASSEPAAPVAVPLPPTSAPEPPSAPAPAPAMPDVYGSADTSWPQAVGRLEPWQAPAAVDVPTAGPSSDALAPGQHLNPAIASAAATPAAWYGGHVLVDDALMVWNSPAAQAETHAGQQPSLVADVSAAIAPSAPPASAVAAAVAPTTSAPARAAAGRLRRLALVVGVPSTLGIGIAFAIDRFLL